MYVKKKVLTKYKIKIIKFILDIRINHFVFILLKMM